MSTFNRTALINTTYQVLLQHYQPCQPPADRSLFEHLLYACCLENARPEAADDAFAKLQQTFFDWNEVRVTTIRELSEIMASLPAPVAAATRLKRALQHVFETHYSFDIESLKKQNLGKAVKDLQGIRGVTPFIVDYVTQHGLGGHAIPLSASIIDLLTVLGIVTETEARRNRIPGLERAVPKAKGVEFASLLHQFAADFALAPSNAKLRPILLQIDPGVKERLAQRLGKAAEKPPPQRPSRPAAKSRPSPSGAAEEQAGQQQPSSKRSRREPSSASRTSKSKDASADQAAKSDSAPKPSATKQLSKKKPR
ncbi:MAG: hypothetical protein GX575_06675 [Candidatus Anammoximicrobium sp.]|nr:hypothetical protein [Candidatus Anammoximicrobium sp.]